jgi:hypothetical protein
MLFLLYSQLFPQEDIKVISSTSSSIVIEFTPQYQPIEKISANATEFSKVSFSGASVENPMNYGEPEILVKRISIGVPSETGNTIQVLDYTFEEKSGQLLPVPFPTKDNGIAGYSYSTSQNYYQARSEDLASFGDFGFVRDFPTQTVLIKPVQFITQENKFRLYKSIRVKISFAPSSSSTRKSVDPFMKDCLLNYDVAKIWTKGTSSLKKVNANPSILSSGKWTRFETPSEGMYKITRAMLSSFGIDAMTVDPRTIKIYNNGGTTLPENPEAKRPEDLVENAITVYGEADGKFDDADYILFYGRGTDFWNFNANSNKVIRSYNPYSKQNYYWITSGGTTGKRIALQPSLQSSTKINQTSTQAYIFYEDDKINIGKTGRYFVGDEFTESIKSRNYALKLDGLLPNSTINYNIQFINNATVNVPFKIEENGTTLLNKNLSSHGDYSYGTLDNSSFIFNGTLPENRSLLKFTYSPPDFASTGYLDYYEINYTRDLKYSAEKLIFYSNRVDGIVEYQLSNFSSSYIRVFDISDNANVKEISSPLLLNGGEFRFQANETSLKTSKYIACVETDIKTPLNPVEMTNQNLHGTEGKSKFIIITAKDFKDQANRLKNYRENESKVKISTTVIDVDDIFNEFSCGMKDPSAIRDFLRYAYDNWSVKPEYVLLFGDGDYDYKNIEGGNGNFIIPFETSEFLDEIYSYASDDFYSAIIGNDKKPDLAIGRLPVRSSGDAKNIIDKVIDYETNTERGSWRNLITLVADDGKTSKGDNGSEHTGHSEDLANYYIPNSFDLKKIYLAAYPTVITGLGRRKPDVNQAIIDAINSGTVLLNFVGHGSPELWTDEHVFVQSVTIPQLVNKDYFFLTAATCDFGYWDKTGGQSSAEDLVLKESAAAIGAFSSVRPVYSDNNAALNQAFYANMLLSRRDTMNLPIPIGKAYFLTKSKDNFYDANSLKFHLFADPVMRLQIPQENASVDSINHASTSTVPQLKALGKVNLSGAIRDQNNSVKSDFNGEGILTIFDSQRFVTYDDFGPTFKVVQPGGIIFKGRVSVANGVFNTNFIVPKDISYENKNGKIVFYFYNNESDGVAVTSNVIVGGTDSSVVNDGKGPEIEIRFDDLQNESGYLVNPNSSLLVKLSDETGLNTTGSGIGHKLEAVLNDNESNMIDLSNYFTGDLDAEGKSGEVKYKFNNLDKGENKILVKAWDVFNNFSSQVAFFKVVDNSGSTIDYVMNYPNPSRGATTFTFQHNIEKPISVKIKIYSVAGRTIAEIEKTNVTSDRFVRVEWNGRDNDGNEVANGVYLYKIMVKSVDGSVNQNVIGKMAIVK